MSDFRDVEFNEQATNDQLSKYPVLREGWMRFVVSDATVDTQGDTDNIKLQLKCSPLTSDNRRDGAAATLTVMVPLYNPKVENHRIDPSKLKTYAKMCGQLARSVVDQFPWYPRQDKDAKGVYITTTGEKVDAKKYMEIKKEVDSAITRMATKWVKDPTILKEETFYCQVKHTEGRNGGTFANISAFDVRNAPPPGEEVITENFTE